MTSFPRLFRKKPPLGRQHKNGFVLSQNTKHFKDIFRVGKLPLMLEWSWDQANSSIHFGFPNSLVLSSVCPEICPWGLHQLTFLGMGVDALSIQFGQWISFHSLVRRLVWVFLETEQHTGCYWAVPLVHQKLVHGHCFLPLDCTGLWSELNNVFKVYSNLQSCRASFFEFHNYFQVISQLLSFSHFQN